jgi:hypothetical protein
MTWAAFGLWALPRLSLLMIGFQTARLHLSDRSSSMKLTTALASSCVPRCLISTSESHGSPENTLKNL